MSRPDPTQQQLGKFRADHPDTAAAAAVRAIPASGTQRRRVLTSVMMAGLEGRTDEEIQDELGMNPSTQRPRRVELVEMGWLEDSGRRRPTRAGRTAAVWVVIP